MFYNILRIKLVADKSLAKINKTERKMKEIIKELKFWEMTKKLVSSDREELRNIIEKIEAKQLALCSVSNQRELLIAFAKYMEEDKMYARHDEANVDDFLENYSN